MKITDHPSLDNLYGSYEFDTSLVPNKPEKLIQIRGKGHKSELHVLATTDTIRRTLHIESIEGVGVGHELMILILIEAYYERVLKVTLDARSINTEVISQERLENFYRKFGFTRIGESSLGIDTSYMEGVEWPMVENQIKIYIESTSSTTPRT